MTMCLNARHISWRGAPRTTLPHVALGKSETCNALIKKIAPQPSARGVQFTVPGRRCKYTERIRSRAAISSVDICSGAVENADALSEWLSQAFDSIDYSKVLGLADDDQADSDEELDDELEELIYGEFSLPLFCALMEELKPSSEATLLDIGSGRGQLVLAAAKGWGWGQCVGLEIVPELFYMACAARDNEVNSLKSPCEFVKGSMYDAAVLQKALAGSNRNVVAFLYATKFQCMPPPDEEYLLVSAPLREALPIGSTVITVNKKLKPSSAFELVSERRGPNPEGGEVLVYMWKVIEQLD